MTQHETIGLPGENGTHPPTNSGVVAAVGNLAGQIVEREDHAGEEGINVPSQAGLHPVPDQTEKPRPPHADPVRGIAHFGGGDAHARGTVGAIADFLWGHDGSKHRTKKQ